MATDASSGDPTPNVDQTTLSSFEYVLSRPPILESVFDQIPTETILQLYHTSRYLRDSIRKAPAKWRNISFRLSQPSSNAAAAAAHNAANGRQQSNYSLDQLLIAVVNPWSTRLASIELDNTSISGATITQTILNFRRETLLHLSVRGCKNVSLKYHINPWLHMHALARNVPKDQRAAPFDTLALKSLYTYRCRHHRRRPYLPSSLVRKESDSEPTHELVKTCHLLDIWTDTAWCTTPGARCYRRRGYVTMRVPQDPREVWVVYDRLWRSRNWLGPLDHSKNTDLLQRKRKRDCRFWENDEEAINGEPVGVKGEGKAVPTHERQSHKRFTDDVKCSACDEPILERCEQCSVMMHCSGCRKTLCASCAFDRPYLRNKNALEADRNKFWWAPGCAISPCSMQDQDLLPPGPNNNNNNQAGNQNGLPSVKFKWCCTEPVFSGGGGITFGNGSNRETDRIRAAPLPQGQGWEDKELLGSHEHSNGTTEHCGGCRGSAGERTPLPSLAGRWTNLDDFFHYQDQSVANEVNAPTISVPRMLCDECYTSDQWKVKCKGCNNALCLRHDLRDRLKVRICGYKDLTQEKQDFRSRQKAMKILGTIIHHSKDRKATEKFTPERAIPEPTAAGSSSTVPHVSTPVIPHHALVPPVPAANIPEPAPVLNESIVAEAAAMQAEVGALLSTLRGPNGTFDHQQRPTSPGSSTSGAASRSSSPTPSASSLPATPEPKSTPRRSRRSAVSVPKWTGCQSFFCPAIRPPGDHRRRCVAVMRQCSECKTHVCGDCAATFEPPCPCKGCQVPQAEGGSMQTSTEPALFFCPNCRWDRMLSGKCKRRTDAFLDAQAASKRKGKKRKDKPKKPLEQRHGSASSSRGLIGAEMDEAMDGLADFFFTSLGTQDLPGGLPGAARELNLDDNGDLQEIEDVGAQARDLIRRIQSLRLQFRPGSIAARALPDVSFEDISTNTTADTMPNEPSPSEAEAGAQDVEV